MSGQEVERYVNGVPVRRSTARQIQAINEAAAIIVAREQRDVFMDECRVAGTMAVAKVAVDEASDLHDRVKQRAQGDDHKEFALMSLFDTAVNRANKVIYRHGTP